MDRRRLLRVALVAVAVSACAPTSLPTPSMAAPSASASAVARRAAIRPSPRFGILALTKEGFTVRSETSADPIRVVVAPILEEIANEQSAKIRVAKLDVDQNPITAGRFGVRSIPTMILFKNGREAQRLIGYMPKERLLQQLNPHLSQSAA